MQPKPDRIPAFRNQILCFLKEQGESTVRQVAQRFSITHEGARRQLTILEKNGWIARGHRQRQGPGAGRPMLLFSLTQAGDHLFPKQYDSLTLDLVQSIIEHSGPAGFEQLLASLSEKQVKQWQPRVEGKPLHEQLELLRSFYREDDPFMTAEAAGAEIRLIERDCPFLNVALAQPAFCSATVSAMQRLLGVKVVREKRFQNGDRRCVFRVMRDHPMAPEAAFATESDPAV